MTPAEFKALKADIAERDVVVPIDIDEDGTILDGHHRYRALGPISRRTSRRPPFCEPDCPSRRSGPSGARTTSYAGT